MIILIIIFLFIQIASLSLSLFGVQMSKNAMYEADSYEKIILLLIAISFFATGAVYFAINILKIIYNLCIV